ncbi:hypothetical protein KEM54_004755 [Ascosphaera aggregata]|nr:hypothetical protein KEM54_004755 [Ascosphaera aggregata]
MDHFSLAIPKFSHATSSSPSSSSAAWTHITSSTGHANLMVEFCIQGSGGFSQRSRTMRVSRDQEVLENLDLNWLARMHEVSCSMGTRAGTGIAAGPSYQGGKTLSAVIVKSPCLAVRYQVGQQIRRFQIKFGSDADFAKAVSILADAGCPITESPITHKQAHMQSRQVRPQVEHHTQLAVELPAPSPDPFTNQGQSQLPATVPPGLTMGVASLPTSTALAGFQNPSPVSSICSPIKPSWQPGGLSLSTPSVNTQSAPTTAFWEARNEGSQRPTTHGGYAPSVIVSSGACTLPTPGSSGRGDNGSGGGCQLAMARPSTAPVSNCNPLAMPPPPLPPCTTMPTAQNSVETAYHESLPPRRELPFLSTKKGSNSASLITKPDKESTLPACAKNAMKSQKPRITPLGTGKRSLGVKSSQVPTKQRAVAEKPFKSPVKRRQTKAQIAPQAVAETANSANPALIHHKDMQAASSAAIAKSDNYDNDTLSVAPTSVADMRDHTPWSGVKESGVTCVPQPSRDQVVTSPVINNVVMPALQPTMPSSVRFDANCPTAATVPQPPITVEGQLQERDEEQTTMMQSEGGVSAEQVDSDTNPSKAQTERLATSNGIHIPSSLTNDLTAYMAIPTPERMAVLESWVCAQLESEDFLKLCEDVEGVWRRIGYGF